MVTGALAMSKNNDTLRLGMIGAGRVTKDHHLLALSQTPEIEVTALADIDESRLMTVADRFAVPGRFSDYQALVQAPTVDIVAVCVPPQYHAQVTLAALAAGKHTFIEKPLALSLADCDAIIDAADASDVSTAVGFNLRGHRLMRQARAMLIAGLLGEVQAMRMIYTSGFRLRTSGPGWRNDRQSGGDVLFEVGSHGFDLFRFFLDAEFESIYAVRTKNGEISETASVSGRMTSGVQISGVFADRTGDALEVDIFGTEGRLHVSGHRFDGIEFSPVSSYPGSVSVRLQRIKDTLQSLPTGLAVMRRGGDFAQSYQAEWIQFVTAIRTGEPVYATLDDGRAALTAVLAALQSADQNAPVTLLSTTGAISKDSTSLRS